MKILAVITYDDYKLLAAITHPTLEAYAERIGAKFIVLGKSEIHKLLQYDYERIILVDSDLIIRPDTPSLFDVVPEGWVGAYNYGHDKLSDLTTFAAANH